MNKARPFKFHPGNRASPPSYLNTEIFAKERVVGRDLGNRASPVELAHTKWPIEAKEIKFLGAHLLVSCRCMASCYNSSGHSNAHRCNFSHWHNLLSFASYLGSSRPS